MAIALLAGCWLSLGAPDVPPVAPAPGITMPATTATAPVVVVPGGRR